MAMEVIDRISEYLAALPIEAVAMLAPHGVRACDALLRCARTPNQPTAPWHAKPNQVRRIQALKQQVTAGGGADLRQLQCCICFGDYSVLKGIECGSEKEKHFLCEECLSGHVTSAVNFDSIELFTRRGGVGCVVPGCEWGANFSDADLAKVLPDDVFAKYTTAKERIAEQRINSELEAGFQKRLRRERERARAVDREAIKEHI